MFIELTDHLRCPADHPESYLVLLPDRLEGRRVVSGLLGCPVCGREVRLADGVVDFGDGVADETPGRLTPDAVRALLGLDGPGGYLALVGGVAAEAEGLAELYPGVHLVLVNPPTCVTVAGGASVLRAGRWPLKRACMRGVVVGGSAGGDAGRVADALSALLPGNRMVVEGPLADLPEVEILAAADGVWVGRRGQLSTGSASAAR